MTKKKGIFFYLVFIRVHFIAILVGHHWLKYNAFNVNTIEVQVSNLLNINKKHIVNKIRSIL